MRCISPKNRKPHITHFLSVSGIQTFIFLPEKNRLCQIERLGLVKCMARRQIFFSLTLVFICMVKPVIMCDLRISRKCLEIE